MCHMEHHNLKKKEKGPANTIDQKSYTERTFQLLWNALRHYVPPKTMVNSKNYCHVLQ